MKEVAKRPTAESMVSAYQAAIRHLEQAFDHINTAKRLLKQGFVAREYYSFLPYKFTCHSLEGVKKYVTKTAWTRIIDLLELPTFMPPSRLRELRKQIEQGTAPEITTENVLAFCSNVYNSLPMLLEDMAKEAFEWLRPSRFGEQYKTNKRFQIGKKVIKNWAIDTSYGLVRIRSHTEEKLQVLDNVFHLLDGKGGSKYPSNAITAIREAIQAKKWSCETRYFKFKWFKKGTLHVEFKRLDLLKKLNKIGSDENQVGKQE